MSGQPAYLRASAIADTLGLSLRTVRRWIATGQLPRRRRIGGARLVSSATLERLLSGASKSDLTDPNNEDET